MDASFVRAARCFIFSIGAICAASQATDYEAGGDATASCAEIMGSFSPADHHIEEAEAGLSSSLAILPKSRLGRLDSAAVRYVLHRYFVRQRGWHIEGLDAESTAENRSLPLGVAVLRSRLPSDVLARLARCSSEQGFTPHEVAILAAVIERFIHDEAKHRLIGAYKMLGVPMEFPANQARALQAVYLSVASFILGKDPATTAASEFLPMYGQMNQIFPSWNVTQAHIQGVLLASKHWHPAALGMAGFEASDAAVSFSNVAAAMEAIGDRQGKWVSQQCQGLKSQLLSLEDHGTGRVRLSDFYGQALGGNWQLQESVTYLRQLGALDESNPSNMRVVIPNYVGGLSNCIGASEFHSVCCPNECEAPVMQVEEKLNQAEAAPADIAAAVLALSPPPPTLAAEGGSRLPDLFMHRLQRIALDHGGRVPVHGRLFAQWMHHLYPRECPYPHLAGSTHPLNLYELEGQGGDPLENVEGMRRRALVQQPKTAPLEAAPWVHQEELPFPTDVELGVPPAWATLHAIAAVAAVATAGSGLLRMAWKGLCKSAPKPGKFQHSLLPPELAMTV